MLHAVQFAIQKTGFQFTLLLLLQGLFVKQLIFPFVVTLHPQQAAR